MQANSKNIWTPFTLDHLLSKHKITEARTLVLLLIWVVLIAVSMISVYLMTPESFAAGSIDQRVIYKYFMLYPPLIIGTLLLFWFGFEWGFIPVFLATFIIAFATDIEFYWAILFAFAFVLGLGIYALAFFCVPVDKSLRDFKSFGFFVVISFVAALASSLGSFIWSFAHDMPVTHAMTLWKGWWTGVLFQSILIIAPLLILITPTIDKIKRRWYEPPVRNEVTMKWIYGAILNVTAVLALFIIGANSLGLQIVDGIAATLPPGSTGLLIHATESFQIITWISIGLLLVLGLGGIHLVGTWNKQLTEEVEIKTNELKESRNELKESLQEKERLLDGIHQRMKNNLTVILALLELQVKQGGKKEIENLLRDSHSRLRSLALVHETMYQTKTVDSMNLKTYTIKLANRLHQSRRYKTNSVDTTIHANDIYIDSDRAMPFAMIINELIVNAYVHAFDDEMTGVIQILIDKNMDEYIIEVKDNGIGLPYNLEDLEKKNLGLKLVKILAKQMHGNFSIVNRKKSYFRVTIPSKAPAKKIITERKAPVEESDTVTISS